MKNCVLILPLSNKHFLRFHRWRCLHFMSSLSRLQTVESLKFGLFHILLYFPHVFFMKRMYLLNSKLLQIYLVDIFGPFCSDPNTVPYFN